MTMNTNIYVCIRVRVVQRVHIGEISTLYINQYSTMVFESGGVPIV